MVGVKHPMRPRPLSLSKPAQMVASPPAQPVSSPLPSNPTAPEETETDDKTTARRRPPPPPPLPPRIRELVIDKPAPEKDLAALVVSPSKVTRAFNDVAVTVEFLEKDITVDKRMVGLTFVVRHGAPRSIAPFTTDAKPCRLCFTTTRQQQPPPNNLPRLTLYAFFIN